MNRFDEYLKRKAQEESIELPDSVKQAVEDTLCDLSKTTTAEPPKKPRIRLWVSVASAVACFALFALVLLPNVSIVYAKALQNIPIIGSIVKVVTAHNYSYSDDNHEMSIDVPQIEDEDTDAVEYINMEVDELTQTLAERFRQELEEVGSQGHSSIYVNYEVLMNTDEWFTLKIQVYEAAGSSNTYYRYYHIDKVNGSIVRLGDLSSDDGFYKALTEDIKRQMRVEMAVNPDKIYWVDDAAVGWDFTELDGAHNFYWTENGDIVIAFDKYEVAPGFMGTPEFVINKSVFNKYLKPEYRR